MNRTDASIEELNQWMLAHHMHGYWMLEGGGGGTQVKPHLWKWTDISAGLRKAGELVTVRPSGMTEMRTVGLKNPGQRGVPGSISLSPQILMPGERTRTHHNLKNETRFVIEAPPDAVFIADGEAFPMEAGDLVVSPAGNDHDHYNGGNKPAVWLDGLDMGLLNLLGTEIDERYPVDAPYQAVDKPDGFFAATREVMKNLVGDRSSRRPPVRYSWSETYAALTALRESDAAGDPHDGILLRYTSPVDRGPALPTFSCEIQLLTPGLRTRAHRHNSTAIYHVVRGEGRTVVAGERLEWSQGDIFCVPPWSWHHHENAAREDAILFSIDDWPAMTKMGFYRIEGE